ncbi:MAG TPA: DUF5110 domain-containing protein, partial [bacterium]|nr:DUF5110 domain-containing protein [bacterium]
MRIHSASDPLNDRRPWLYGSAFEDAARRAYRLRASLVPYLYGASRQCYESGLPLLRPLYLHYPNEPKAYDAPHQYLLGQDLLVAGAARPGFGPRRVLHAQVWFPEGDWYHWETLERFTGPLETMVPTPLEGLPLFVRGGAPLCIQEAGQARACAKEGALILRVLPGPPAERELYEDDGESVDYKSGAFRKTRMATRPLGAGRQEIKLGPSRGAFRGGQGRRPWILELPLGATVSAAPGVIQGQAEADGRVRVALAPWPAEGQVELQVHWAGSGLVDGTQGASRSLALRAALASEQLPEGHPMAQALADLAQGAATAQDLDLEKSRLRTMTQVLDGEGRSSEAAVRVLAGVSLLAHVTNDTNGRLRLQLELRRGAEALVLQGPCRLRWRQDTGAWSETEWTPAPACVSRLDLPLDADRSCLGWLNGDLEMGLTIDGQRLTLRESFTWDGRAVKDWLVLGPHADGPAPEPAASAEALALDQAHVGLNGAALAWQAHAFNPSRVAREVRHFYNLGDVFQCKESACSALAVVQADQGGPAECEFYHDGKARLWLNGVELDLSRGRRQSAALESGSNLFWVRLSNVTHQGRGLYLAMHSTDGGARGLRFCLPDGVALPDRNA